jgi:hypothetical protein
MDTVTETSRASLLATLGVTGFLLVVCGVAMFVAVGMGVHFRPAILVVTPPIVGLPIAAYVWKRAAHELAEMARGNIEHSGRRTARFARRLGVIGSVIGTLTVGAMVLAIVVGVMVFGSDPSAPY